MKNNTEKLIQTNTDIHNVLMMKCSHGEAKFISSANLYIEFLKVQYYFSSTLNSTRRFNCRPSSVSLVATGTASP